MIDAANQQTPKNRTCDRLVLPGVLAGDGSFLERDLQARGQTPRASDERAGYLENNFSLGMSHETPPSCEASMKALSDMVSDLLAVPEYLAPTLA